MSRRGCHKLPPIPCFQQYPSLPRSCHAEISCPRLEPPTPRSTDNAGNVSAEVPGSWASPGIQGTLHYGISQIFPWLRGSAWFYERDPPPAWHAPTCPKRAVLRQRPCKRMTDQSGHGGSRPRIHQARLQQPFERSPPWFLMSRNHRSVIEVHVGHLRAGRWCASTFRRC